MNLQISTEILVGVVSASAGVILTFVGQYLFEKRKERLKKNENLLLIECVEMVNQSIMVNNDIFGPMANHVQIKVPEAGPKSQLIDMRDLYFAKYRLRNLSDSPVSNILIKLENEPKSVWFAINEGKGQVNPDWEAELRRNLMEKMIPEERGWDIYPIPYINPYSSTRHEVFLELASFLPLNNVTVTGGAKGVKFVFKKLLEQKTKKFSLK
jgi:hypothetical protein